MSADFTPEKRNYKILPPFKMQVLTNFPYIEADFDALTNYQLLCKVVEYLNMVIHNENELTEEVEGLYNAYVSLQNYVNNYFDNLDVQDEINNKLDEMAESGQLTDIIAQYLGLAGMLTFNTVADMKAAENLVNGSTCITLGYYNINDGGGATYKIVNNSDNNYHQELLDSGLYANLIIQDNQINIKQLGAKCCIYPDVTNKTDSKNYILEYENLCNNNNIQYKLYIPNGLWFFSETLISRHLGVNIIGETNFSRDDYSGTIILPYNNNQSYIWKIGGNADYSSTSTIPVASMVTQSNFNNLTFSTGTFINSLKYKVNTGCLILDRCDFMTLPNINIMHFNGNGLVVRSTWEVNIGNLMFRNQSGFDSGCMLWDDVAPVTGVSGNISAFDINNMMSEGQDGYLIYSAPLSGASHNHIGHINIENAFSSGTKANLGNDEDVSSYTPVDLIKGFFRSLIIDSINFFDNNNQKTTENGTTYYFRSLFKSIEQDQDFYSRFNIAIGVMTFRVSSTHEVLAYSHNAYKENRLTIGALNSLDSFPKKLFDYEFGMNTYIGSICIEANVNSHKDENDAINIPGVGRNSTSLVPSGDKCLFKYDELAPSFCHLVIYTESGTTNMQRKNGIDSSIKCRVLYRTTNSSVTSCILYGKSNGSTTYTSISTPVNTDNYVWSSWSNAINCDMSEQIIVKANDINIAKVEFMSGN